MQNLYQMCYDLINTYIFGGSLVAGTVENMFTVMFSMVACFAIVLFPFVLIWGFIKRVFL